MITIDGKEYELKFTVDRFSLAERSAGVSFLAEANKTSGMLQYHVLKTFIGYGLKVPGEPAFLDVNKGYEQAEKYIQEVGMMDATIELVNQLKADLGFLFAQPTRTMND